MKTSRTIMALFLIIGLTIMGLLISGCEKMKQAEAPKQEAAPAPAGRPATIFSDTCSASGAIRQGKHRLCSSNSHSYRGKTEHAAGYELSQVARL